MIKWARPLPTFLHSTSDPKLVTENKSRRRVSAQRRDISTNQETLAQTHGKLLFLCILQSVNQSVSPNSAIPKAQQKRTADMEATCSVLRLKSSCWGAQVST